MTKDDLAVFCIIILIITGTIAVWINVYQAVSKSVVDNMTVRAIDKNHFKITYTNGQTLFGVVTESGEVKILQ